MIKTVVLLPVLLSMSMLPASRAPRAAGYQGWFSDKGCAAAKIKSGDITPNGTACVKKCLEDGATPVFVDQKAGRMYAVVNYASLREDVGYYLEVDGTVDEKAETITIRSTKRLGDVIQMCGRKKSAD